MNIAFIVGCAQSGTSILGELIASHPEVKYIHEAHHIWEKAGLGENESHRLTAAHATPLLKRKIWKRFERESEGASHVVEKCPRNALRIPFLREVFPEAKIIHIIRHGRDVACSFPNCRSTQRCGRSPKRFKTPRLIPISRKSKASGTATIIRRELVGGRENLKEEEAQAVENLLRPLLTRLGYIRGLNDHERA